MVNISSSLVGLSLLTGGNAFSQLGLNGVGGTTGGVTVDSRKIRDAKALFTTPATVAPWQEPATKDSMSTQVAAIKAMKTIIDKKDSQSELPEDVQTSFTTYKALDRLRILAETAAAKTTSDAVRKQLNVAFEKGLADLKSYLGQAPSDLVEIGFGTVNRRAESVKIAPASTYQTSMDKIVGSKTEALPGLTGNEKFSLTLSRSGINEKVTVDLSTGPQPPTLESVTSAFNAAIGSIPARDANGNVVVDNQGVAKAKYAVKFTMEKETKDKVDRWGFGISTPLSTETVSIEQVDAKDALMVTSGRTALDAPTSASVIRFNDASGALDRKQLTVISALDREATERAKLEPAKATATVKSSSGTTVTPPSKDVMANTDAKAIVTDADGNSYIVGTTEGELGSLRPAGEKDLFLTKIDSEGNVIWQRGLGATGSAEGAAVTLAPDGSVVVSGTVTGTMNGSNLDGDMLVAKFSANGDEQFATAVRAGGVDQASAVAVGADGSVFVGGKNAAGDAILAKLDSKGAIVERRTIDSGGRDAITALTVDANGDVVALMSQNGNAVVQRIDGDNLATDLGSINLGAGEARAIAIADDGTIAVGGAAYGTMNGAAVNASNANGDGFVARIDANLSGANITYLATDGQDQVDSLTFMNGDIYVGGRTTGALGGAKQGAVDGFVSRIDGATGAIEQTTQWGTSATRTEPVRVSAAKGNDSVLGGLGLNRGALNPAASAKLTTQTSLRAGDEFSFKIDGGRVQKITIQADDTMATLAKRMQTMVGTAKGTVLASTSGGSTTLRIDSKAGHTIELIPGGAGKDALEKLGIEPQRLSAPPAVTEDSPKVTPGGRFGLELSNALSLNTSAGATAALGKINSAISMSQSAYRSLYWDDTKAMLVEPTRRPGAYSGIYTTQLANYQAALDRLATPNVSMGF